MQDLFELTIGYPVIFTSKGDVEKASAKKKEFNKPHFWKSKVAWQDTLTEDSKKKYLNEQEALVQDMMEKLGGRIE